MQREGGALGRLEPRRVARSLRGVRAGGVARSLRGVRAGGVARSLRVPRTLVVVLLIAGLAGACAAPVGAATASQSAIGVGGAVDAASDAGGLDAAALAQSGDDGAAGNSTGRPGGSDAPLHEHPDRASGSGDDDAVAQWLLDRLEGSIEASTVNLSEGEYDAARSVLGDEYDRRLEQYVDVADDTRWQTEDPDDPRTRDEVAAQELRAASESQRELATLLAQYEETLADYQEARDRGDEQRARELARELVRLADRVEALGGDLTERYERLETVVEKDLSPATAAIENVTTRRQRQAERVASRAFANTTLRVATDDPTVGPGDPLTVAGRLVAADGDPVAGATIEVSSPTRAVADGAGAAAAGTDGIGSGTTTTVQTDSDGVFRLEHHVGFVPTSLDALRVRYVPEQLAPYRSATERVPVDVQQVDGTLSVDASQATVRYGDAIEIGVEASASGRAVPGVPLRARLEGATAAGTTGGDGAVELRPTVPRDVSDGDGALTVSAPVDDWSVAFPDRTANVTVRETDTSLTAAVRSAGDGGAGSGGDASGSSSGAAAAGAAGRVVAGRLTTSSGEGVADAPIEVAVDAGGGRAQLTTVRTDEQGAYRASLDASGGSATVRYAEPGNLANASASAAIPSGSAGGGGAGVVGATLATLADRWRAVAIGALAVVGVAAAAIAVRRRGRDSTEGDDGPEAADDDATPTPDDSVATAADAEDAADDPLSAAEAALSDSPTRATVLAYGAGRSALRSSVSVHSDATHAEFLAACEADGLAADEVAAVRELTECYERAAFAPGDVHPETARTALEAARELH